ncbi:hypothetical protein ACJROX_27530 [Pseudalkalibacillus sp. A8]|uniref:hypothetical protein n=1 Tax=Pseudalkalibacillus sp. A8 TaxID=3382641 RepID=UPI0038B600BF
MTGVTSQPSRSVFGAILLKKVDAKWIKIWETKTKAVGLQYSGIADITGDGIKEYLFGTTIGASARHNLDIYEWNKNTFSKISDVLYHKLELLNNKNIGIAVWQRYIADTIL